MGQTNSSKGTFNHAYTGGKPSELNPIRVPKISENADRNPYDSGKVTKSGIASRDNEAISSTAFRDISEVENFKPFGADLNDFDFDPLPVASKRGLVSLMDDSQDSEKEAEVSDDKSNENNKSDLKDVGRNLEVLQAEVDEILEESFNYSDDIMNQEEENRENEQNVNEKKNAEEKAEQVRDKMSFGNETGEVHAGGDIPEVSAAAAVEPTIKRSESPVDLKDKETTRAPSDEQPKRTSFRNVFAYSDSFEDEGLVQSGFSKTKKKKDDFFSDSDDDNAAEGDKNVDKGDVIASLDDFGLEDEGSQMVAVEVASFEKQTSIQFEEESEVSF